MPLLTIDEVLFPTDISYGSKGGPEFKTTVKPLGSGHEQRNIDWDKVLGNWEASKGVMTQAKLDIVETFFYARNGRARGFRWKHWPDFTIAATQQIGVGDGVETDFQSFKIYTDAGNTFNKDIYKVKDAGSIRVYLDTGGGWVLQSSGFTVDINTCLVIFSVAPAVDDLIGIQIDEYHWPVRFNIDKFEVTLDHVTHFTWGSIPIKGIRL